MTLKHTLLASVATLAFALLPGYACAADTAKIPAQTLDKALRARLPKEIQAAGEMTSVNSGSFPPYEIVSDNRTEMGATADLCEALGQILGIKIKYETVSGMSAQLIGIKSGRYQFAMGPIGDFPERQAEHDFVDYVQEHVVFAVQAGNPLGIRRIEDTGGKRVAVMAGGSAERVIKQQSQAFVQAGSPEIQVQSYQDQPTAILAVSAKRADAFFSSLAPLSYFVKQSNGALELAGIGAKNGFGDLFQGAVVPKNSPLGPVLRDGLQKLFSNGTYALIMKKWGLEANMLKAPAMNMAKK